MRRPLALLPVFLCAIAFAGDLPKPLARASAGQWTIHARTETAEDGKTRKLIRHEWVEKVEGSVVTLRQQLLAEDLASAVSAPDTHALDRDKLPSGGTIPGARVSDEVIELKGKRLECKKIEVTETVARNKLEITRWVSAAVPISGVVRTITVREGKEASRVELLDWGETGGTARPVVEPGERR